MVRDPINALNTVKETIDIPITIDALVFWEAGIPKAFGCHRAEEACIRECRFLAYEIRFTNKGENKLRLEWLCLG